MNHQTFLPTFVAAAALHVVVPGPAGASTPMMPPTAGVSFEAGGSQLSPEDDKRIEALVGNVRGGPRCAVIAARPDAEDEAPVQEARTAAVRDALVRHGMDAGCVEVRRSTDTTLPMRVFLSHDPRPAWDAAASEAEKDARLVPIATRRLANALNQASGCGAAPGEKLGEIVLDCSHRSAYRPPRVSVSRIQGRDGAFAVSYEWSEPRLVSGGEIAAARDVARGVLVLQRVSDVDRNLGELFAAPQENHGGSISIGGAEAVEVYVRQQGNAVSRIFHATALPGGW